MTDEDWAPPTPTSSRDGAARDGVEAGRVEVAGYSDLVEVARGGDSVVYRAKQRSLDREVAIKVIQLTDPQAVARFQRELEITVRLGRQHPHIVTVLEATTTSAGEPCLIMEFHDLGSLHDRLAAQGPLSASEVVEAGTAVADALAFAHAAGVLHRDVKPQNILVLPTSYVLSDFGIARRADAGRTASLERFSYRHASPQILDGLTPTVSDDVWSLGSTLFTLLEGRAPFSSDDPDDDSALAYLRRVRTGERRPMRRTDLPAGLRELVEGCLVPDRDARIESADRALAMLRGIRTEGRSWDPITEPPGSVVPVEPESAGAVSAPAAADAAPGSTASTDHPAEAASSADRPPDRPGLAAPVARSALADLAAPEDPLLRPPGPDGDATGTLGIPRDESQPAATGGGTTRGRGWRRVAAFIGGMLLAGAAIGVTTALVRNDDTAQPAPTHTRAGTTVPTARTPVPGSRTPQATVSDPALAPQDLVVTDRGTSALLTWSKPQREVDSLVVVRMRDDQPPEVLANLSASRAEYTVEGLNPDGRACFAVVGYGHADGSVDAGASAEACTG